MIDEQRNHGRGSAGGTIPVRSVLGLLRLFPDVVCGFPAEVVGFMRVEGTTSLRVRYAETDAMGVVYYGNYFTWFEVGRSAFCRDQGTPYSEWEARGVFLPCVESHCRYKQSARYDEEVLLRTWIEDVRDHSVTFAYRVERSEDGRLLAEGWTKHAFCDRQGKLLRCPQPFSEWLESVSDSKSNG
jgi:acyl-CoA thioester hydrolase